MTRPTQDTMKRAAKYNAMQVIGLKGRLSVVRVHRGMSIADVCELTGFTAKRIHDFEDPSTDSDSDLNVARLYAIAVGVRLNLLTEIIPHDPEEPSLSGSHQHESQREPSADVESA